MQKSEVNKQTFRSLYIGINAILGMVTTNRVNLVQVCSLNIEQSRLLQLLFPCFPLMCHIITVSWRNGA